MAEQAVVRVAGYKTRPENTPDGTTPRQTKPTYLGPAVDAGRVLPWPPVDLDVLRLELGRCVRRVLPARKHGPARLGRGALIELLELLPGKDPEQHPGLTTTPCQHPPCPLSSLRKGLFFFFKNPKSQRSSPGGG